MSSTKRRTLDSQGRYTICIITALAIELTAVLAVMDERHDLPPDFQKFPLDKNTYVLGKMGRHNVVVTSLEIGSYGTLSAAATAKAMITSFPWIRIGLVVGTGGAISRPHHGHDIRLGDVVVSKPEGRSGGVVQYDLGKARNDSSGKAVYEHVGFLGKPPPVLLKAIQMLSAEYDLGDSTLPTILDEMLKRNPTLVNAGFVHQGAENDRLFDADFAHPEGESDCDHCRIEREVHRYVRDTTLPEIHYGVIASGNTLMRDADKRDAIVASLKSQYSAECVCFEMEAAGLMNILPCLVIRGISNYSDSHKNDRWQKYAAATAAAYAKELLLVVPSDTIGYTPRAIEVLDVLRTVKRDLTRVTTMARQIGHNIEAIDSLERDQGAGLWLSPLNPSQNCAKR